MICEQKKKCARPRKAIQLGALAAMVLGAREHADMARRIREGGLDARLAVQRELEEARSKAPGFDPLTPPPRSDPKTLTKENRRKKLGYTIPPRERGDDDTAALLMFTRSTRSQDGS